jgi:ribosomal protein L11 methyltransferase
LLAEAADAGEAGGPLVDLGTGSGVLAIAAAKLGWGPVSGYDHEPAALEAAEANAAANGVTLKLERVNLRDQEPPTAETVVANLTAPLLLAVAQVMARTKTHAPRRLICSGLLPTEADRVAGAFAGVGMDERDRRVSGDWAALSFRRP